VKLSLWIVTKNSAAYIEPLLKAGHAFADEIVVAVDASSTDATGALCRGYADKLFRIPPIRYAEEAAAWMGEQCTGDWILRLDDDELPSAGLIGALPRLLRDREVTHYWLPRRWVIGREQARWIAQPPWWSDWQLRLFRNIRSIVRVPGGLHTSFVVQGGGRFCTEGSIYHFDLVYHSDLERRQKVERYERISPGNSLGHLYLPPDDRALITRPLPSDDAPWAHEPEPGRPTGLEALPGRRAPSRRDVGGMGVRDVTRAELRRSGMQTCDDPTLFRAALECIDGPPVMTTGQWCWVDLDLRNESATAWPSRGLGVPRVRVGYRWFRPTGQMHVSEGWRTDLPHTLRPGETTRLPATVFAPEKPGRYILRWELAVEDVAWFAERGWRGPEMEVRVVEGQPGQAARLRDVGPTGPEDLGPNTIRVALALRRLALRYPGFSSMVKRVLRLAG